MPTLTYPGVGRRIAYQRRLARMTQQHLADAADASLGAVRKIERGERNPSEDMLEAFADAMGVDAAVLRYDAETTRTLGRSDRLRLRRGNPAPGPGRPAAPQGRGTGRGRVRHAGRGRRPARRTHPAPLHGRHHGRYGRTAALPPRRGTPAAQP
ncbi:helix-turn-helix transcriptional regulator [Streptomyces diastatochromogenes]|nr:helix-turn-helix transcriptional regulator [Streptomyces diastatochromogenes]MCZ0988646.1 helix-turn-helix transcriptional regulator [Streptomyces diastatochromogenes]